MNKNEKLENVQKKSFLTLDELLNEYKKRPKNEYLWSGIKEKSFGIVFGPAKSGKSIFCENLGMSIAMGRESFFSYPLSGKPRKVLFIGLEEFWEARAERNKSQLESLNEVEQELVRSNYMSQPIEFSKRIISRQNWQSIIETITESEAEIVVIDSITRMNHGKLEDSSTVEVITQKLREICYDLQITLICIHHTPKLGDNPIVMDSMKGSSVFSQEADFAIAVRSTSKKNRYIKNVFYRYAPDDDDMVKEFVINSNTWLDHIEDFEEDEILKRTDRRRNDEKREFITGYFDKYPNRTFQTKDLVSHFKKNLSIEDRQIKTYLSDMVKTKKILNPSRGLYQSNNNIKKVDGRI